MIIKSVETYRMPKSTRLVFRFDRDGEKLGCDIEIKDNMSIEGLERNLLEMIDEMKHYNLPSVSAIGTAAASGASEQQRASNRQHKTQPE